MRYWLDRTVRGLGLGYGEARLVAFPVRRLTRRRIEDGRRDIATVYSRDSRETRFDSVAGAEILPRGLDTGKLA